MLKVYLNLDIKPNTSPKNFHSNNQLLNS